MIERGTEFHAVQANVQLGTVFQITPLKAEGDEVLVRAEAGLLLFRHDHLTLLDGTWGDIRVVDTIEDPDGGFTISTTSGLFRLFENSLSPSPDYSIHDVIAEHGVFALTSTHLARVATKTARYPVSTGKFSVAFDKLFMLDKGHLSQVSPDADIGYIYSVLPSEHGNPIIWSERGLFELRDNKLAQVAANRTGDWIESAHLDSEGWIFSSDDSVTRLTNDGLIELKSDAEDGTPGATIGVLDGLGPNLVLVAQRGAFRITKTELKSLEYDSKIGQFTTLFQSHSLTAPHIIAAERGLFAVSDRGLRVIPGSEVVGDVIKFIPYKDGVSGLLVHSSTGLYSIKTGSIERLAGDYDLGYVLSVTDDAPDGHLLIVAEHGLFDLFRGAVSAIPSYAQYGRIQSIISDQPNYKLLLTERGAFGLYDNGLYRASDEAVNGASQIDQQAIFGDRSFVVLADNLYEQKSGRLWRIDAPEPAGEIRSLQPTAEDLFVAAAHGLYRLAGQRLERVLTADKRSSGEVFEIVLLDEFNDPLIAAKEGAFLCRNGILHRFPSSDETGAVYHIEKEPDQRGRYVFDAEAGLFVLEPDDRLRLAAQHSDTGYVIDTWQDNGAFVAVTANGVLQLSADSKMFQSIAGGRAFTAVTDSVANIPIPLEDGDFVHVDLLATDRGLFRIDRNSIEPISSDVPTGGIIRVVQKSPSLIVSATEGLFGFKDGHLTKIDSSTSPGAIFGIVPPESRAARRWKNGLVAFANSWRQRADGPAIFDRNFEGFGQALSTPTVVPSQGLAVSAGSVYELWPADMELIETPDFALGFLSVSDTQAVILGTHSLYEMRFHRAVPLQSSMGIGEIRAVVHDDAQHNTFALATEEGVFRLRDGQLSRVKNAEEPGEIFGAVQGKNTASMVAAERGLFAIKEHELVPVPGLAHPGSVKYIGNVEADGSRLIVSDGSLYRLAANRLAVVPTDNSVVGVAEVIADDSAHRLFASTNSIMSLVQVPLGPTSVELQTQRATVRVGVPAHVEWIVHNECAGLIREQDLRIVDDEGEQHDAVVTVAGNGEHATITAKVKFAASGTENVHLELREGQQFLSIGQPAEIRVNWGIEQYVKHYGALASLWFFVGHTLLFAGLILGAGRWHRCWKLLDDPFWGATALWFGFALRQSRTLQLWVLRPWYGRQLTNNRSKPFLVSVVRSLQGRQISSEKVVHEWRSTRRVLWLRGNPGMGKTSLVEWLRSSFFQHETLSEAIKQRNSIPVAIALRDYLAVKPLPGEVDELLVRLVQVALGRTGLPVLDSGLVRAMLSNNVFCVLLDGGNEYPWINDLEQAVAGANETRVLFTSQVLPQLFDAEVVWELPSNVKGLIGGLLELRLEKQRADSLYRQIVDSGLVEFLHSGYDVMLVAELAFEAPDQANDGIRTLPASRGNLYDMIIRRALGEEVSALRDQLCRGAWEMTCKGERSFKVGGYISDDLIDRLKDRRAKVVREIRGDIFEFRHDQMRGYLAARWAAQHRPPAVLLQSADGLWRLGPCDQEVLWSFFAELVDRATGEDMWRWATQAIERTVLQHALQRRGEVEGWLMRVGESPHTNRG